MLPTLMTTKFLTVLIGVSDHEETVQRTKKPLAKHNHSTRP